VRQGNVVASLDVGTSKVAVMVGRVGYDGELELLGTGSSPANGLRRGVVVEVDRTTAAIRRAVAAAERMAGVEIESVVVGLSGDHLASQPYRSSVLVSGEDHIITPQDVERVMEAVRLRKVPPKREIITILAREFIVDGVDGIFDPVGMVGMNLEVSALMVTGAVTAVQNLLQSVYRAGLEVEDLIPAAQAAGEAVLLPEEKDLGVIVADIGAGTSDVAWFQAGTPCAQIAVPIGGSHITNDIAVGLRTTLQQAEELKLACRNLREEGAAEGKFFETAGLTGQERRKVSERELAAIVEPRVEEIFALIKERLFPADSPEVIPGGLVLTGGTAELHGIAEFARAELGMSVRLGRPALEEMEVDPPTAWSVAAGLLRYAADNHPPPADEGHRRGLVGELWQRIRSWFEDIF
jgi:cell division protein FtsA